MSDLDICFNSAEKIITYLNLVLPATGDHTEPEALCRFRCLDEIC